MKTIRGNFMLLTVLGMVMSGCKSVSTPSFQTVGPVLNVTPDSCKAWNLPTTSFRISWPEEMQVIRPLRSNYNDNYIELIHKTDSLFYESLLIGRFEGGPVELLGSALLNQLEASLRLQYPEMQLVFKGRKLWQNRDIFQLHAVLPVIETTQGDPGRYKFFVGLIPPTGPSANGVMVMFQSEDRCKEIADFEDFGIKGKTGRAWQTFAFTE